MSEGLGEASRVGQATTDLLLSGRSLDTERRRLGEFLQNPSDATANAMEAAAREAASRLDRADASITIHADGFGADRKALVGDLKRQLADYTRAANAAVEARRSILPAETRLVQDLGAAAAYPAATLVAGRAALSTAAAPSAANMALYDAARQAAEGAGASPLLQHAAETAAAARAAAVTIERARTSAAEEISVTLDRATELQVARVALGRNATEASAVWRQLVLLAWTVAVVMLGSVVSVVIARGIVRPLRSMTSAMTRLAGGDANIEVRGTERHDEVGAMARAVDVFRQNADKIVAMLKAEDTTREIGGIISQAAKGDLTTRVPLENKTGFLRDIADQVNRLLDSSNAAFRGFGEKTRQTAGAVGEASMAVGQVSDGARTQMSALSQVAKALGESAKAIRGVSETTRTVSEKAKVAAVAVDNGLAATARLAPIVESIAQNSRKVRDITQVIGQIADRTHILSLNAAIEAARAGEHGKGFVVVAQEVGKLAESAGQNAQQIREIVEQATLDTAEGKQAAELVRVAMQAIAGETSQTTQMIYSVSAAMEEQQETISQVDASVGELRTIAASNAAAAEEIAATMIQVSRMADETKQQLATFRTG